MYQTSKNREATKQERTLAQLFAQAWGLSLRWAPFARRGLEKRGTVACASPRLGDTSSPERDGLSLKTGARRLSDSSHST